MYRHLDENLSLGALSEEFELSKSYLNLIFQKATGHTPMDFFQELKMKEACKLLLLHRTLHLPGRPAPGLSGPLLLFADLPKGGWGVADGVSGEGERAAGYVILLSLETIHVFEGRITVVSHNRGAVDGAGFRKGHQPDGVCYLLRQDDDFIAAGKKFFCSGKTDSFVPPVMITI